MRYSLMNFSCSKCICVWRSTGLGRLHFQQKKRLTDRQKTAAKRIYDLCIWFLYEFERTDGFNDYWLKFKESGSKDPEMDIYSTVEDMIGKINMALDQEYFDLRGFDLRGCSL